MTASTGFTADVFPGQPRGVCVVALAGRLDPLAAEELTARLDELYRAGERRFVVDLAGLEYLGSVGIRVLLLLASRVKGDGTVCLCSPSPLVRQALDIVRIGNILRCYPTRRDAEDAAGTV